MDSASAFRSLARERRLVPDQGCMFKLPGLLPPFGVIALLVRLASTVRPQVPAAVQHV